MGRKLNLSHLSEEECEKILHVLQKDFEVRQTEKERIGCIQNDLKSEQNKTQVLSQQRNFNKNCCIRCCQVFGLIFNRRRQCFHCGYNVCKNCCVFHPDTKTYRCYTCEKEKELSKQSCGWFYSSVGHKFRRFGSAKVVRSLYRSSSYCKLRHAITTQGGLNSNRLIVITNKDDNNNSANRPHHSDTELDRGYTGSGESRSVHVTSRKNVRPPLPDPFRRHIDDDDEEDKIHQDDELPPPSPSASARTPAVSRSLGGHHPVTRAASVDTLHLPSSPLSSSSSSSTSKRPKTRTTSPSKPPRASTVGKSRTPDPGGARARWDDGGGETVKKETKANIYKHAFENARQAEEHKFKLKFDVLLKELHRTLDQQSPQGLTDSFASTSYGEVMLSFRGRVKDLLLGFTQRLQLAYESFDSSSSLAEEHGHQVRQDVSRLLEDLLGESLDLTSDEAVSDLSSLSDDSANDRHAFEDQIAQAVVSKILDSHRREVHHLLHHDRHSHHLDSPHLVPEALNDDDVDDDHDHNGDDVDSKLSPTVDGALAVHNTDISKDFDDLRHFVQETQSRSKRYEENGLGEESVDGVAEACRAAESSGSARVGSGVDTCSRERELAPLPDFSQFDQIDFNSGEVDPDLLQMNLMAIPEETDDQLEEYADTHWRENWIFKGQASAPHLPTAGRKRLREDLDHPQYVMVPQPEDDLAPKIGNTDVDQLSDNEELLNDDDDHTPFSSRASTDLAELSRHPTPPSSTSTSLPPTPSSPATSTDPHHLKTGESLTPKKQAGSSSSGLKAEDVPVVPEEELAGPTAEKIRKELKLLDEVVPAEGDDPKFVVLPESVTIQEGEPVKLSCRVAGTQPIDVFWYREQQEVEELEEGEDVELQMEGERHLVTLYNLGRPQAGQYMCIALSDLGKAIKYFTITVKDNKQELKKPEFLKELKDVEVVEGQSVRFRVKVKGYPQPRINWYKDGKLLRSNRSCRIEKFGNRDYILTMDYATMDDDAEYMVVAKNVAGEVRSTAQVIVEPYAEDHPLLLKNRTLSMSTVYTDPESDRPSSLLLEDVTFQAGLQGPRGEEDVWPPSSEDSQMQSLLTKMNSTKEGMRQEAENMLLTANELSTFTHHLEDMERHLGMLEGGDRCGGHRGPGGTGRPCRHRGDPGLHSGADQAALDLIAEDRAVGESARNIRKLTSNALSVLRAAEEIIQSEKQLSHTSSPPSSPQGTRSTVLADDPYHLPPVSLGSAALDQSLLTAPSDLMDQSVSSGYGTISMTSSAMEDNGPDEDVLAESSLSLADQDEFALYLPALDDPCSGSYREEVSITMSSGKARPSGTSSSSSSSTLTDSSAGSSASSRRTVRTVKAVSPMNSSMNSQLSPGSSEPMESPQSVSFAAQDTGSSLTREEEEEEEGLLLNFGPKEIPSTAYSRDYEVATGRREGREEVAERKRWSVTLDPFVPTAEVVNRQPSLEETEEQIYLAAGRMFQLEGRVKELQGRVEGTKGRTGRASLDDLQGQVVDTAVRVARSEKEVSSIERAVHSLQFSPRSSRGSQSSTPSTPRESVDSGVSSFAPEQRLDPPAPRAPPPVLLTGHSQEGDLPESRTEFDADSGIELPSVTRLRAMFGGSRAASTDDEPCEGSLRRVHSITARSLTKDQLQKLRDAGNATLPDPARPKTTPAQSTASLHLQAVGQGRRLEEPQSGGVPPPLVVTLSHNQQQQQQQQAMAKRQIRTTDLPQSALYKDLDPSHQPVLIFPETDKQGSPVMSASGDRHCTPSTTLQPTSEVGVLASSACPLTSTSYVAGSQGHEVGPSPKIRSGCISARAAFWERRIMQGEATDVDVEEEFPEMVQDSQA